MNNHNLKNNLGINLTLIHQKKEQIDLYISRLRELKIEWIRLTLDYNNQPNINSIHYLTKQCQKHHIKVVGLLSNIVPGTIINLLYPRLKNKPIVDQIDKYKRFVTTYVFLLKHYVKHWQILNEVNTRRFWIKTPNPKIGRAHV